MAFDIELPAEHAGVQFIKDYHAGKYGYAVRSDAKALMYHQALQCPDERQVKKLFRACENHLLAYESHAVEGDHCAWVTQGGRILYCKFASHRWIAEDIFFTPESEFEKNHAKITYSMRSEQDIFEYMEEKPSQSMRYTVKAILNERAKFELKQREKNEHE